MYAMKVYFTRRFHHNLPASHEYASSHLRWGSSTIPPSHRATPAPTGRERANAKLEAMRILSDRASVLVGIKSLHSAVWLFFAGCIVLIPLAGAIGRFLWAGVLSGLVLLECVVLALNRGRCPLTDVAARYTDERAANFDIYLPEWLARYNKEIFGVIFVLGEVFVVWRWFAA